MNCVLIPESKSMANRILIISSYLNLQSLPTFTTQANDVIDLSKALQMLFHKMNTFTIRDGGTTLRFLLTRLSRETGSFTIKASQRLLSRPHEDLFKVLSLLGTRIIAYEDKIELYSQGWIQPNTPLVLDCEKSTQFASALLLNAIELPFDITFQLQNLLNSKPYLDMTVSLLQQAGLSVSVLTTETPAEYLVQITKNQKANRLPECEIDVSSAFSVAAAGVVHKGIGIKNFPKTSLQADSCFVPLLHKMGIEISPPVSREKMESRKPKDTGETKIPKEMQKTHDLFFHESLGHLKPIQADVTSSPDLFPVLSALCALANGTSYLSGVTSLPHKESHRLNKSIELLQLAGAQTKLIPEGLLITGPINPSPSMKEREEFVFDPDHDHRMAMAAAVLKAAGVKLKVLHPEVVNKSLPGFWEMMGINP